MGAMFNGPKFKKERDQLLMSHKLKDVVHETTLEANKVELEKSEMKAAYDKEILEDQLEKSKMKAAHDKEILEEQLEKSEMKATHDKEILGEQLRSEQREKASLSDAHDSQIQSIHIEKALRNIIELEYTKLSLYANGQKYELKGSVGIQHLFKEYHVRPRCL